MSPCTHPSTYQSDHTLKYNCTKPTCHTPFTLPLLFPCTYTLHTASSPPSHIHSAHCLFIHLAQCLSSLLALTPCTLPLPLPHTYTQQAISLPPSLPRTYTLHAASPLAPTPCTLPLPLPCHLHKPCRLPLPPPCTYTPCTLPLPPPCTYTLHTASPSSLHIHPAHCLSLLLAHTPCTPPLPTPCTYTLHTTSPPPSHIHPAQFPAYLSHCHFHWNSNWSYHHSIRNIKEIWTIKNGGKK